MTDLEELYDNSQYTELLDQSRQVLETEEGKHWHLLALWRLNRLEEALQRMEDWEDQIKSAEIRGYFYNTKGIVHRKLGNFDQALENYQISLSIREKLGNKDQIAGSLNNIGGIYFHQGKLSEALDFYERSLSLKDNPLSRAITTLNIGNIYYLQGDLTAAFNQYVESLNLISSSPQHVVKGVILNNLGSISFQLGRLREAKKHHLEASNFFQKIGLPSERGDAIRGLIDTLLLLGEKEEAREYLEELELVKDVEGVGNYANYLYASASVQMDSKNLRQLVDAQSKFSELMELNNIDTELKLDGMRKLIEIYVMELRHYEDQEIFENIQKYLNDMLSIATSENLYPRIIECQILQSRVKIIQGEVDSALNLLDKAVSFAEERQLLHLKDRALRERKQLMSEIDKLHSYLEKTTNFSQRIDTSDILSYLRELHRKD